MVPPVAHTYADVLTLGFAYHFPTVPPLQKTALMPLKRNPPDGGFGGNKGTGTIALKGGYGVVMGHGTSWQAPAYK
jgi:hypothetical protein